MVGWCSCSTVKSSTKSRRNSRRMMLVACALTMFPPSYWKHPMVPTQRKQYGTRPVHRVTLRMLWHDRKLFRMQFGFSRGIFVKYILAPMYLLEKQQLSGRKRALRKTLSLKYRLMRYMRHVKGAKVHDLVSIYGQGYSSCYADLNHIAKLFETHFFPKWCQAIDPHSPEHDALVGRYCFEHFKGALYAGDVTEIPIARPLDERESLFYSGKKATHTFACLCFVDSRGVCRITVGPTFGSVADITLWRQSVVCSEIERYAIPYVCRDSMHYGMWLCGAMLCVPC